MKFNGRAAAQIENDCVRVTVLEEGCHIAEILHKQSGISPLWIPPWRSIEPSQYDPARHPEYGLDSESKLLAGIMGHNLCLDIFGPPSSEEAAAGLTVHGESSTEKYAMTAGPEEIDAIATLPLSGLKIERRIRLAEDHVRIHITESVENLLPIDRPIAWTEHVTLGPPFIEHGVTQFDLRAERSQVFDSPSFDSPLVPGADFDWPLAPTKDGGSINLATFPDERPSAKFTTHLMNRKHDQAFFTAYHPKHELLFGYRWKRSDFPWLGIWEENRARTAPPWNGKTITCGMEFGVSPFPETRREMVDRGQLFGVPGFRWLPARGEITVEYVAFILRTEERSERP